MNDRPGQYGMERAECPIQALLRAGASRSFGSIVAQTQLLIFRRHRPLRRGVARRVCAQDAISHHDEATSNIPIGPPNLPGLSGMISTQTISPVGRSWRLLTSAKITLSEPDTNSFRRKLNRTNLPWRTTMVSSLYRRWRCWPC